MQLNSSEEINDNQTSQKKVEEKPDEIDNDEGKLDESIKDKEDEQLDKQDLKEQNDVVKSKQGSNVDIGEEFDSAEAAEI